MLISSRMTSPMFTGAAVCLSNRPNRTRPDSMQNGQKFLAECVLSRKGRAWDDTWILFVILHDQVFFYTRNKVVPILRPGATQNA